MSYNGLGTSLLGIGLAILSLVLAPLALVDAAALLIGSTIGLIIILILAVAWLLVIYHLVSRMIDCVCGRHHHKK